MYECVCLHTWVYTPVCVYSCVNLPLPKKRKQALLLRIFAFLSPYLVTWWKSCFHIVKTSWTSDQPKSCSQLLRPCPGRVGSCWRTNIHAKEHLVPTAVLSDPCLDLPTQVLPGYPVTQSLSANQAAWEGRSKLGPLYSWPQAWIASALLVMWIKDKTILPSCKKWPGIIQWVIKWNIQGFENVIPPIQVNICRPRDHRHHRRDVDLRQDIGHYWKVPGFKECSKGISAVHWPQPVTLSLNNNLH